MTIIVIRGPPDDSAGTMNKKYSHMLVAFFRHIHQHRLSPLECWRGTRPSHAAKWWPFLNSVPLPIAATTAVAVLGPMHLTLAIRWQASDCLNTVSISLSKMDQTLEIVKEIIEFGNRPAHSNVRAFSASSRISGTARRTLESAAPIVTPQSSSSPRIWQTVAVRWLTIRCLARCRSWISWC